DKIELFLKLNLLVTEELGAAAKEFEVENKINFLKYLNQKSELWKLINNLANNIFEQHEIEDINWKELKTNYAVLEDV
ncbi:MAG: hypothetical protein ACP5JY_02900, partial [Candidatus Nanoarchaeia archaeon]